MHVRAPGGPTGASRERNSRQRKSRTGLNWIISMYGPGSCRQSDIRAHIEPSANLAIAVVAEKAHFFLFLFAVRSNGERVNFRLRRVWVCVCWKCEMSNFYNLFNVSIKCYLSVCVYVCVCVFMWFLLLLYSLLCFFFSRSIFMANH